jgi:type III pantothenate kinase
MDALSDPRTQASLVIFEIGNSHVAVGSWAKGGIRTHERFPRDRLDGAMDYAAELWAALPEGLLRAAVAGSVVPRILDDLRPKVSQRLSTPLLAVGEDLRRPMNLAIEEPQSVGIDRLCCAAAAYDHTRQACVAASFGTAITIDCVNDEGVFLGGAILPGLDMQARGLHESTALLPQVKVQPTGAVYGANTEQAIRNGVIYGAVGALREITERYASDLGRWPQLVVTGGNAEFIKEHCNFIDSVVPDLCVQGIALAYRRHFAPFDELEW